MTEPAEEALCLLSLNEAANLVRERRVTPSELVTAQLARIERLAGGLNCYITVCSDAALAQARVLDEELDRGEYRGPLHGIPISLKDNIATAGIPTTAGSRVLRTYTPHVDAAVVTNLKRAGAIVVAKANMSEFAYGGPHPDIGPALNPWNPQRTAGGSSSGSAASVAADLCYASLGTDTGGSIRIPAAMCGVVGFKPSYGRVPREGVIPVSANLDHVGPMTRSVVDAALLMEAMQGARDADTVGEKGVDGLRIGRIARSDSNEMDDEVWAALERTYSLLKEAGAVLRSITLPDLQECWRVMTVISGVEAAEYHHRTLRERPHDLGPGVRLALERAEFLSGTTYVRAQRLRKGIVERMRQTLVDLDGVLLPTVPIAAHPQHRHAELLHARQRYTTLFNLTGLPALSLPVAVNIENLPLSVQVVAHNRCDSTALRVGEFIERSSPRLRPPLEA